METKICNFYNYYYQHCDQKIYEMTEKQLFHSLTNLLHISPEFQNDFILNFGEICKESLDIFIQLSKEIDTFCYHFICSIPFLSKRNGMSFQEYILEYIDNSFKFSECNKLNYVDVLIYSLYNVEEVNVLYKKLLNLHNSKVSLELSQKLNSSLNLNKLKKK
jgi:hypothetical protein